MPKAVNMSIRTPVYQVGCINLVLSEKSRVQSSKLRKNHNLRYLLVVS